MYHCEKKERINRRRKSTDKLLLGAYLESSSLTRDRFAYFSIK